MVSDFLCVVFVFITPLFPPISHMQRFSTRILVRLHVYNYLTTLWMQSSSITLNIFFLTKFTIWGSDTVLGMVIFSNFNHVACISCQSVQCSSDFTPSLEYGESLKENTSRMIRLGTVSDNTAYFHHPDIV